MIIHLTLLVLLLLLLLLLWLKPYKFIHAYYYKSLFVWCVSRKIHVMRGKSCDHSNNVAFCYFLSFFGPPMPCLYEEKLPTHLTELPSIVVSITVMIFFHITPSSPRSSHIWFSYIHNFRATLYEPTFLTFPYKTWQKVGWTKRLAQQADMWWYMWATVQSSIVNFSPYSLCIILHYGLSTEVN